MQRGVAKGLQVPRLFIITEVSIRCQKNPEVGIRRIPAYTPQYTTASNITVTAVLLCNKTKKALGSAVKTSISHT